MPANPKYGGLGGLIAVLGLAALVAGLVVRLVWPGMGPSAWGILAVGIILLAVAFVINFRRVKRAVTGRRGRFGLGTAVMTLVFIGIIVLVNAISIGNYQRLDTSSLSQFTLTSPTVDVLEGLDRPVKAVGFIVDDPDIDYYGVAGYVTTLLNEYQAHSRELTVSYVDPDEHPDQAKQYGITEYQSVVFTSGDGYKVVSPSQYLIVDSSGSITGVQAEYTFTSAILEVTGVAQKKVYFLTGHGEADIDADYSLAGEGLRQDLYLVATLNLMTGSAVPDDCAVLVIAAPQTNLTDGEVAVINDYLNTGGQALILTNPNPPSSLGEIISPWGVEIGEGTIIDPASSVSPHQDMPLVPAARDYFLLPDVYFPGAAAIIPREDVPDDVSMAALVYTTSSSWLDKDFAADEEAVFDAETEEMQALAIGVLIIGVPPDDLTGEALTRLAVIGDADFASDEHFDSANNGDLFLNAVSWLAEETELVSIRQNVQPFRRLVVTAGQESFIKYTAIGLLPLLVLAAGAIVWWRRR